MVIQKAIYIFGLLLTLVCVTTSKYAGVSFKLDRFAYDEFENPTATRCDWAKNNRQFCTDTHSRCKGNCCKCTCDYATSTFDRSTMTCRQNAEIRGGCNTRFENSYAHSQIKLLDITTKGKQKIKWPNELSTDEVAVFTINSISWYRNGSMVKNKFLTVKGKPKNIGGFWEVTIEWKNAPNSYKGEIFYVNTAYTVERKTGRDKSSLLRNDCLVFKSTGKVTVTFPSLTTTVSSTESSTDVPTDILSSPTTDTLHTRDTPTTKPQASTSIILPSEMNKGTVPFDPPVSANTVSNPSDSATTQSQESRKTGTPKPSLRGSTSSFKTEKRSKSSPSTGAREESSGSSDNAVVISLVVVGCLVLLIAIISVVLWSRKRSRNTSVKKNGNLGTVIANRNAENPVMMSTLDNIYAEADNNVNYPRKNGISENNYVYDYAEGNVENNYNKLDANKREVKPDYESLVNVRGNLYEQIPAYGQGPGAVYQEAEEKPGKNREAAGRTGPHDLDRVYSVLEDEVVPESFSREVPGRTDNDDPERVYSVLEDEAAPEHLSGEVPGMTGNEDLERVYSTLEDETADYLTVLPETERSEHDEYEQPVNPPVFDA